MIGLFDSKEKKIIKQIEKYFEIAQRVANAIVALDPEHTKKTVTKLAAEFNDANNMALKILYQNQEEFNFLKKDSADRDEIEFNNPEYNKLRNLISMYYMSKQDYLKFEKVMTNAVIGVYGEYSGQ